ncbi:MAG: hypothetical protein AAGF97_17355 [Planctomycetota bacterium]
MSAAQVVEEIRTQLAPVNAKLADHAFVRALNQGAVSRDTLRCFAGEQYAITESGMRSDAALVSRFTGAADTEFFLKLLIGEKNGFQAVRAFAHFLEWGEDQLAAYEPSAGGFAYASYFCWLAHYGSDAELAAAVLVNFQAWGENCGRMRDALAKHYGFTEDALELFRVYAVPSTLSATDDPLEGAALQIIEAGLNEQMTSTRLARAARLLQSYELMFWDSMFELHGAAGH